MRALLTFFILLLPPIFLQAQKPLTFSYSQTLDEIERLTLNIPTEVKRTYRNRILYSEEWCNSFTVDDPLRFIRYYRPDGTLLSEGLLESYFPVGCWNYYDMTGNKIKMSDYSSMKSRWDGPGIEPYRLSVEKARHQADSFLNSRLGATFYSKYVRFSAKSTVICESRDGYANSKNWLDVHDARPDWYRLFYSVVLNDSLWFDVLWFDVDTLGNISNYEVSVPDLSKTTRSDETFKIDCSLAMSMATEKQFKFDSPPTLVTSGTGFSWKFTGYYNGTPNRMLHRELWIETSTGKVDSTMVESTCDHCDDMIVKNAIDDTLSLNPGWRKLNFGGLTMNIPNYWSSMEECYKTGDYSSEFLFKGRGDTLLFRKSYGQKLKGLGPAIGVNRLADQEHLSLKGPSFVNCVTAIHADWSAEKEAAARKELEECLDSRRKAEESWRHIEDSLNAIEYAYSDSVAFVSMERARLRREEMRRMEEGETIAREFKKSFPDGKIQGREFELQVTLPYQGKGWSVYFEVNDAHGGFGVGQKNYHFEAKNLTDERFQRMMEVFRTARFLTS